MTQKKRFEFPATSVKGLSSKNASVAPTIGTNEDRVVVIIPASVELAQDPYIDSRGMLTIIGHRGGGDVFGGINLQVGHVGGNTPDGAIRIERPAGHRFTLGVHNNFG